MYLVGLLKPNARKNGQGGIRTHDTREGIPVFETGSFSHSDTCPKGKISVSGKETA
jgi:hypothetical protein